MSRLESNPPNAKQVNGETRRGKRMHVKCPRCDGMGKHNGFNCALCGGRGHGEEKVVQAYQRRERAPFWNQDDHRREEG